MIGPLDDPADAVAAVAVEGVTHRFGRRVVLSDVTISWGTGVTSLLGPNGAGKTTLLRLISGDLRLQSGRITGPGFGKGRHRRSVGMLPQNPFLPERVTCLDFVAYCAWLGAVPARQCSAKAEVALAKVALAERAGDRIAALSGGMQRRLAIAAALAPAPALLLLDEPSTGLDPMQRADLSELLVELGTSVSVVVATHVLEDVHRTSAGIVMLHEGRVLFHGDPAEFADSSGATPTTDQIRTAFEGRIRAADRE